MNFKENFNSHLSRFLDDVYQLSSQAIELKTNPLLDNRKYLLAKFDDKLVSLLEQVRRLQDLNR